MNLYLSCRRNHLYMLTRSKPKICELDGRPGESDFYPQDGDRVFYNNMCRETTPELAEEGFDIRMRPLDPPIIVDVVIQRPKTE